MNKVVRLSERRIWRDMDERLAKNALIMQAAIDDSRLSRKDLQSLVDLLNGRAYSKRIACTPGRLPESSLKKLVKCGYLIDLGLLPNPALPELTPFLRMFYLTEREEKREWLA